MKPTLRVRQRASSDSVMRETSASPIHTSPSLGLSRPAMRFKSVVLPEPLGPIKPRNSPSGTSRLRLLRTSICSLPRVKNLCTPWTRTMGLLAIVSLYLPAPALVESIPAFLMFRLDQFLVDLAIEEGDNAAHVGAQVFSFFFARDAENDHAHRDGALGPVGLGHQPRDVALVDPVGKGLGPDLAILELENASNVALGNGQIDL